MPPTPTPTPALALPPPAGSAPQRPRGWSRTWSPLWQLLAEPVALLAVLLALAWQFQGLAASGSDPSADQRYSDDIALQAAAPAAPVADARLLCRLPGLSPRLLWRWQALCQSDAAPAATAAPADALARLQVGLVQEHRALQTAIAAGEAQRLAAAAPLARSLAEGVLPPAERAWLARHAQALDRYRARYQLVDGASPDGLARGALPLACAWRELQTRGAVATRRADPAAQATVVANQLALLRGQAARLWWPPSSSASTTNPAKAAADSAGWSTGTDPRCTALGTADAVLADAAVLARQVAQGPLWAAKAGALLRLLDRAPLLLAGWALLAWLLAKAARSAGLPAQRLGWALLAWSAAAVPLWWWQPVAPALPTPWLAALAPAAGLLCLLAARPLARSVLLAPAGRQHKISSLTLPLVVGFIGLGWWLVIDLSVHGHARNRYLALDQTRAVFWALAALSMAPLLAPGLAMLGLRIGSRLTGAARLAAARSRAQRLVLQVALLALLLLPLALAAVLPGNLRQLTGDLFRWLMLPVMAWFFLVRGEQWTLASAGGARRLLRALAPPLVFIGATLVALVLTDDQGPALVTLLTAAVVLGALASQAQLGAGSRWWAAAATGLGTAALAVVLLIGALVSLPERLAQVPGLEARMARFSERVAGMTDPFAAENDQPAHVRWFRNHLPAAGHGFGAVPWCGSQDSGACRGMPAQTQSDYSVTALQGVLGERAGLALVAVYLVPFLGLLALRQARWSSGRLGGDLRHNQVALLAWLAVCWVCMVAIQTLVTVAGNLGALPLTGVTWPFVSFGLTSLLGSAALLGLVMHRLETPR